MQMRKRIVCALLAFVMAMLMVPAGILVANAAEDDGTVTRAEWIQALVETFSMTVEKDNYPDNYYSDITAEDPYYRDIMVAVEFGVIDLEAGMPFEPDAPATREFAAHTLNFCLGYQLDADAAYTFSESASVTYPDDIQIAINRGWFALNGGAFGPEQAITTAEKTAMLEDAAEVLASDVIDTNYKSVITVAEGVVEIPMGTTVEFPAENVVKILSTPKTIAEGDVFVVYNGTMPVVYKAVAVTQYENLTTIECTTEGTEGAIVDYDFESIVQADLEQFEGTEATTYNVQGRTLYVSATTRAISYDQGKKVLTASKTVSLGDGVKASISVKISNMEFQTKAKSGEYARVVLVGDATLSTGVSVDVLEALQAAKSIELGRVNVAGVGYVKLVAEFSLTGEITLTWKGDMQAGFSYSKTDGFRVIASFNKESFTFMAEVNLRTGLKLEAGVDIFVAKGSIWATIGADMKIKATAYDSGTPRTCLDNSGYMYASVGAYAKILFKEYSKTVDIYTSSNSPIRAHYHYEDGNWVSSCTRGGSATSSGYYTDPGSNNFTPGSSSGSSKYTGSSGEPVIIYTYTLDENNLATLTGYKGYASALYIPSTIDGYTVVAIGNSAFDGKTSLYTVRIPNTVTSIGASAFAGCTNLSTVILSDNLTYLGGRAFGDCSSLQEIEIPASLVDAHAVYWGWEDRGPFHGSGLRIASIEEGATVVASHLFRYAENLKQVYLPDSIVTIEEYAFANCSALLGVDFPENLVTINLDAFFNCTSLTGIYLPETLETIDAGAFAFCSKLSEAPLPKNLKTLNGRAFQKCTSLTEIQIPQSLEVSNPSHWDWEDRGVFYDSGLQKVTFETGTTQVVANLLRDAPALTDVTLLDTMTSIGANAFYKCTALAEIAFPQSLTVIEHDAFSNCSSLKEVVCPEFLTKIDAGAFAFCTDLASVTLNKNLVEMNGRAFQSCDDLLEIEIPKSLEVSNPSHWDWEDRGVFYDSGLQKVTFEEGTTAVIANLLRDAPALTDVTLVDSMTTIGESAFYKCTALAEIALPRSLTAIEDNAFAYCSSLEKLECPEFLEKIDAGAFAFCSNLASVTLNQNLVELNGRAFQSCDDLLEIEIPKSLEVSNPSHWDWADRGVFYDSGLKKVTFEEGTAKVLGSMFKEAYLLEDVKLQDTMSAIGEFAFYDCDSLQTLAIPNSVTEIGYRAFQLSGLTEITIPDSVVKIGDHVLADCPNLKTVTWTSGTTAIPEYAFAGSVSLETVNLPDTVTKINKGAFRDCDALVTQAIPDQVVSLANEAFYNCDALTSVELPDALTTIGANAFENCDALISIVIPGNVTSIGNNCFYDCDALTSVTMGNSVTSMGSGIFRHCDVLKNVTLSLYLTSIPGDSFRECAELEQIIIPYFTTSIGNNAFNSSPKLAKVVTGQNLTSIGSGAFSYADVTVFYGASGSYTETWAGDNHYKFVVNDTAATSVALNQTSMEMVKGATAKLVLNIAPADFGDTVAFKSSKTDVVTVSDSGELKAVGVGTATIKVTVGSVSASCKVTVTQAVTRISLNKSSVSLEVPNTYQLTATISPSDASNQTILWTSDNESAATVDENGLVTAVGNGTAVITAAAQDGSGVSASCTFTVVDPSNIPVSGIKLNSASVSLDALDTFQLTATVSPDNAANKGIVWTSSDETVATVDENGVVTALTKGSATITATAADGNGAAAECAVTVRNTAHVAADVAELESTHPYADSCTDAWFYTAEGATSLEVTFDAQTEMEDGFDYLHIYDGEGNLVGTYTGTELAGQTVTVPGDTVKIQLETDDSGSEWGFKVTDVSFAHVHTYGEWTQTKAPSCGVEGEETRTCTCGESEKRAVAALSHSYESAVVAPTCTEQGYTRYTCTNCSNSYDEDYTPATGHSWDEGVVQVEPTEETEGLLLRTCSVCGESVTEAIPVLGHTHKHIAEVTAPTCTEQGYTTYTCTCGDSYVDDYVAAVGHSFESGICGICGAEGEQILLGDANGDGVIDNVDAMMVLQYAVGLIDGSGLDLLAGDVDGNGTVDNVDAMKILQFAVGLIGSF